MQTEGPVYLQYVYASDIANIMIEDINGPKQIDVTMAILNSLAKLGYKLAPLSQKDFDMTDGNSIVHNAYKYAVDNMVALGHLKYQDYVNMLPEDVFDKDKKIMEHEENIFHISQENYEKQLSYQAKVISTFVEDINSYKNLNKGS